MIVNWYSDVSARYSKVVDCGGWCGVNYPTRRNYLLQKQKSEKIPLVKEGTRSIRRREVRMLVFMMDSGERPREAKVQTAEALQPKTITRVCFWDVRTLYQTGKLAQLRKKFEAYNLDLVGISEVRWLGSNRKILKEDSRLKSHTLLFTGRKDDNTGKELDCL